MKEFLIMKPKKPEPIIFDIRKDIHPEKNLIFYTFNKYGLYAFELKDKPDVFQIAYVFTSYASPDDDCDVCIRTIMRDKNSYDTHYEIKIKSQNDFDKLNILFNIYYVDDNFIDWVHFKQIPIKFGEYEPGRDIPKDMELRVSKYNHYCISSDNFDNGCPYKVTNKITSEQFIGAFNENSGEKYELSFSTTALAATSPSAPKASATTENRWFSRSSICFPHELYCPWPPCNIFPSFAS